MDEENEYQILVLRLNSLRRRWLGEADALYAPGTMAEAAGLHRAARDLWELLTTPAKEKP